MQLIYREQTRLKRYFSDSLMLLLLRSPYLEGEQKRITQIHRVKPEIHQQCLQHGG